MSGFDFILKVNFDIELYIDIDELVKHIKVISKF